MRSTSVDHTAAYFALAGALGAALLAIVGNQLGAWRQRKAESHRLERQLTEERARLEAQLRHDRELRDLDEARRVLNPIARKVIESGRPTTLMVEHVRIAIETPTEDNLAALRAARRAFLRSRIELGQEYFAVVLMFGAGSAVAQAIHETYSSMRDLAALVREGAELTPALVDALEKADDAHTQAVTRFNIAAFAAVGRTVGAADL